MSDSNTCFSTLFVFSHPLYLSYFIFFSPYLFKLISFLYPLFLTTFLLLLAFASLFPVAYISFLEIQKFDENEFHWSDYFDVYEIVFGGVLNEIQESESSMENEDSKIEKDSVPALILKNSMEEERLENFLKILGKFERMSVQEKKKPSITKTNKVVVEKEDGSDAKVNNDVVSVIKIKKFQSQRVSFDSSTETLKSYGSMRKEKEWKRTLACKIFEERHNGDGREGMDSLWETYENDSIKEKPKKGEIEVSEEDDIGAQLCCLQALKLSSGKMNLGMRKPSLVKISKAIKGLGWLHGVTKHSKKVHNNNNGDR